MRSRSLKPVRSAISSRDSEKLLSTRIRAASTRRVSIALAGCGRGFKFEHTGKLAGTQTSLLCKNFNRQVLVEVFTSVEHSCCGFVPTGRWFPIGWSIGIAHRGAGEIPPDPCATLRDTSSPTSSLIIARARSMPAVIPAEVQIEPSRIKIRSGEISKAGYLFFKSWAKRQCVVTFRPSSRPVSASKYAPVQMLATRRALRPLFTDGLSGFRALANSIHRVTSNDKERITIDLLQRLTHHNHAT